MTIVRITAAVLVTVLSTAAIASTDCKARSGAGMFANTNPQPVKTSTTSSSVKTNGAIGG